MHAVARKSAVSGISGVGSSRQQRQSAKRHQRPDCSFLFFQQRHPRAGQRRTKKSPDELPPMARIGSIQQQQQQRLVSSASLASSVADPDIVSPVPVSGALQMSEPAKLDESAVGEILPAVVEDWDEQRRVYNAWRLESTGLLGRLGDALDSLAPAVGAGARANRRQFAQLPRYMELRLCEAWTQLTSDCKQEHRQWQTPACLEESRRRQAEDADREARRAAQRAENDSLLMRDGSRTRIAGGASRTASASGDAVSGERRTARIVGVAPSGTAAGAASSAAASTPAASAAAAGKKSARSRGGPLHEQVIAEGPEHAAAGNPPKTAEHAHPTDTLSFSLTSKESLKNGWLQNFNQRLIEDKLQSALVKLRLAGHSTGARTADQRSSQQQQLELQFYAAGAPSYRPPRPRRLQPAELVDPDTLLPRPVAPPDVGARRAFVDRLVEAAASAGAASFSTPLLTEEEARLLRRRFKTDWDAMREAVLQPLLAPTPQPAASGKAAAHQAAALAAAAAAAAAISADEAALHHLLMVRLPARYQSLGGGRLVQCRLPDGGAVVLYPSGCPALLACGWSGCVLALNDSVERQGVHLLAAFNASACGFVRSVDATESMFTCTQAVAQLQDPITGRVQKRFTWPSDPRAKLPINLQVRLNACLTFVCAGRADMIFTFQAEGRSVQLAASFSTEREASVRQRCTDRHGNLLIGLSDSLKLDGDRETIPWKSETAKRLVAKAKQMRKQQQQQQQLQQQQQQYQQARRPPDSAKSGATEASGSSALGSIGGDLTVRDPDLEEMRVRIRGICDSWLEAYRQRLVLALPQQQQQPPLTPTPIQSTTPRPVQSAAPATAPRRRETAGRRSAQPPPRLPSAPPTTVAGLRQSAPPSGPMAVSAVAASLMEALELAACPVTARHLLMSTASGIAAFASLNRCGCGLQVPGVTDLEIDAFVEAQGRRNPDQLLVVMVTNPDADAATEAGRRAVSLLRQYASANRDRRRGTAAPCPAASRDPFRMLAYDLGAAATTTDCTYPALLVRHNLRAGDALIYRQGRIMFAGALAGPEQLRRQLAECRRLGQRGCPGLPRDFRLSTAWEDAPTSAAPAVIGGVAMETEARTVTLDALTVLSAGDNHPMMPCGLPRIH